MSSCPLTDHSLSLNTGCLFSHCCVAPLPVPGGVHVDANGGCGFVLSISQIVCQAPIKLYFIAFTSYG